MGLGLSLLFQTSQTAIPPPQQNRLRLMLNMSAWVQILDYPKISLVICCTAWKSLLLFVALLSPGLGYDTSTTLLYPEKPSVDSLSLPGGLSNPWLTNVVRWDAIYFTQIARRGYLWEQEWAFGWGFTKLIASIGSCKSVRRAQYG